MLLRAVLGIVYLFATTGAFGQSVSWYQLDPLTVSGTARNDQVLTVKFDTAVTQVQLVTESGKTLSLNDIGDNTYQIAVSADDTLFDRSAGSRPSRNVFATLNYVGNDPQSIAISTNIESTSPTPFVYRVDDNAQNTDYVANLWLPSLPRTAPSSVHARVILQSFIQRFGDNFEFVNIVYALPSFDIDSSHGTVNNQVSGIGRTLFADEGLYGSAGTLLGFNSYPRESDLSVGNRQSQRLFAHQWVNYFQIPGLTRYGRNWWLSPLGNNLLGWDSQVEKNLGLGYNFIDQNDGTYILDSIPRSSEPSQSNRFSGLSLYAMGLAPRAQIGDQVAFADPSQVICDGCVLQGPSVSFDADDIASIHGPRTPAFDEAQRHFRSATVVVTRDRLLTPAEMEVYDWFGGKSQATGSFPTGFSFATYGQASIRHRLPSVGTARGKGFLPVSNLLRENRGPGQRGWVMLGHAVVGTGDNDGDGFDDLGLKAPFALPGGDSKTELFMGQGTSRGMTNALRGQSNLVINLEDEFSNVNVHPIGDHNGDGIDDLLVGGKLVGSNNVLERNNLYVIYGTSESRGQLSVSELDGSNGYVIQRGDYYFHRVFNLGDRNGDGNEEIGIFGTRDYVDFFPDPVAINEEALFVLLGGSPKPMNIALEEIRREEVDPTIAAWIFILGATDGDTPGVDDIFPGDFDGDGRSDMAIDAFPNNAPDEAEIWFDRGNGREILSIDDSNTFSRQWLGKADLNDDGYPDLILEADPFDEFRHFVLFGGPALADKTSVSIADIVSELGVQLPDRRWLMAKEAGDLNGDGVSDFVLQPDYPTKIWEIVYGRAAGYVNKQGVSPVSPLETRTTDLKPNPVGDVNGDGLADLAFQFDSTTTIIRYGERTAPVPVTAVPDTSGNSTPEIAQLKLGDPAGIRLFVSDAQTGVRANNVRFFNDAWMPRQVHSVTINSEPVLGMRAQRDDGLPGVQFKNLSGAPTGNVFPMSRAWTVHDSVVLNDSTLVALATRNSDQLIAIESKTIATDTRQSIVFPLSKQWTPHSFAALTTQNQTALALLASRNSDGLTLVQILDAETGAVVRNVYPLGLGWEAEELVVMPDLNSNGSDEVAVRMIRKIDGLEVIQIRDSANGSLISNVYPIGAGLRKWITQQTQVMTTPNGPSLVTVSEEDSDGQVLAQRRNPLTGSVEKNIFFIAPPWQFDDGFHVVPDMTNDGTDEIAVLMRHAENQTRFVQVRDGASGAVIRNLFQ